MFKGCLLSKNTSYYDINCSMVVVECQAQQLFNVRSGACKLLIRCLIRERNIMEGETRGIVMMVSIIDCEQSVMVILDGVTGFCATLHM